MLFGTWFFSGFEKWLPRQSLEATGENAVADLQAATAGRERNSFVLRLLSRLSAPAPKATI
jgi:hypothetical protein